MFRFARFSGLVAIAILAGCAKSTSKVDSKPTTIAPAAQASTIEEPKQKMDTRFGVPIYPGATVDNSRYAVTETTSSNNSKMYLLLVSSDEVEKVAEYYRQVLAAESVSMGGATVLRGRSPKGAIVTVNVARDPRGERTVFSVTALFPAQTAISTTPTPTSTPSVIIPSTSPQAPAAPLVDIPMGQQPTPQNVPNPEPIPQRPAPPTPAPAPAPEEPYEEPPYENPIPDEGGLPPGEGPPSAG